MHPGSNGAFTHANLALRHKARKTVSSSCANIYGECISHREAADEALLAVVAVDAAGFLIKFNYLVLAIKNLEEPATRVCSIELQEENCY